MRKNIHFLLLVALFVLPNSVSPSQAPQETQRIPDGGTREVLISILIPSLPNAPFTATVNAEWIRRLPDGSTITLKNHRAIARDSAGRIFQERRVLVPDGGKVESAVSQIEISDPVSHELYICVPSERVCQVELFSPPDSPRPAAIGTAPKGPGSPSLEDLGKQSIGGLETAGTRETMVIPTGAIGNNSPLLAKQEYWYSSQLGVNLISKRQDPRFGVQNFEVTDIALGEPDAKLFAIPSGSKILDLRKPPEISSPQAATPN